MDLTTSQLILNKVEKRPCLTLFLLGAFGILGFSPFFLFPCLILSVSAFLYLMEHPPFRTRPFHYSFVFNYAHYLFGTYWVGNALLVYDLWYLMPLVWIILPSVMALFQATVTGIIWSRIQHPLARALLVAVSWSLMDYIKGNYILMGFPWNLYGYIWPLPVLQITSIIGIYGLSFLTILLSVAIFFRSHRVFKYSTSLMILGIFGWGWWILETHPTKLTGINIRLIQASIPQNQKWLVDHFRQNFHKHLALSALEMERPLNLIIWPEASVPTFVAKYPALQEALASVVPENGFILVGGPRYEDHTEQTIFTSLLALDQRGQIVDTYDKTHLVPFGEYVPFKHYLPIAKLSPGERDYSPGSGLKLMKLPGIPNFTPLICFEAIFPGHVTPPHEAGRPEWLLNQTNDAWYGRSTGPYQHLQIVRVRAIEEALPLVRSANNGISADIDPHGRILHHLELDDIGFLDFDLPKAAAPTPYSRFGEVFYFLMLLLVTGWALLVNRRGRQPTG